YLARMAKGELGSFDMNSSDATLIRVLGKEALAPAAATALSFRPSREAQLALAGKVTSDDLTPATRASLAASLRAHIQRFGNQLPQDQVKTLLALSEGVSDSALRQEVDLILSSIRGDTAAVGNRLKSYVPATATPATKVEPGTSKDN
ncbi:MAG TPA: hypothetical protein PKA06_15965, partial [Gemmatales bacterium]|nr:hypothetical protein [Gemmatales bacterium]